MPQLFSAVTLMFPFCPALPDVTVIEFVPVPAVMDHPPGTAQVYVVALVTAVMLYINPVNAGHTGLVPVMAPGVAGVAGLTVTATAFAALVPQLFPAVTLMFPF